MFVRLNEAHRIRVQRNREGKGGWVHSILGGAIRRKGEADPPGKGDETRYNLQKLTVRRTMRLCPGGSDLLKRVRKITENPVKKI